MTAAPFDWIALLEYGAIGLLSGGLLALIALGFVLIYKGTGVINFAMGEFMMLGAYFVYTAHAMWGLTLPLALALALAAVALCAALVERVVLRPLTGQPVISVLMATIGLASALHGGVDAVWGGANLEMPALLPRKPFTVGEILVPQFRGHISAASPALGRDRRLRDERAAKPALRSSKSEGERARAGGAERGGARRALWSAALSAALDFGVVADALRRDGSGVGVRG